MLDDGNSGRRWVMSSVFGHVMVGDDYRYCHREKKWYAIFVTEKQTRFHRCLYGMLMELDRAMRGDVEVDVP